jgi:hypothetical protein
LNHQNCSIIRREKSYKKMFAELTGKKFNFYALLKFFFSCQQVNLCGIYEGDPHSPHEGEATHGEIPLTSFSGFFINLLKGYRGGCPSGGGGGTICWSPGERS